MNTLTSVFGRSCIGFLALASLANADVIHRFLPVSNLNEAAGGSRSNASFTQSDPTQRMIGDTFNIPNDADYIISSIAVWSVGSIYGEAIGQEFDSVSLYGGVHGLGDFGLLATGTPNMFFEPNTTTVLNSNPNISHVQVNYTDGSGYEGIGSPGVFYPIWRTTFSNLNWLVPAGSKIDFAVWGASSQSDPNTLYGYWFTHVTNAANSGNTQDDANGQFLVFDFANLSSPGFVVNPFEQNLWDKGADVNVGVILNATPEPGTFGVAAGAIGLLAFIRRRR